MAGPSQTKNNQTKKSAPKKKRDTDHHQAQMKLVSVDTCIKCPTQCERGIRYIEKMSQPGAIGTGVPCILTMK